MKNILTVIAIILTLPLAGQNVISTTRQLIVNVPAGQAIRLCVKGNILAATEMNISYLTITIQEK